MSGQEPHGLRARRSAGCSPQRPDDLCSSWRPAAHRCQNVREFIRSFQVPHETFFSGVARRVFRPNAYGPGTMPAPFSERASDADHEKGTRPRTAEPSADAGVAAEAAGPSERRETQDQLVACHVSMRHVQEPSWGGCPSASTGSRTRGRRARLRCPAPRRIDASGPRSGGCRCRPRRSGRPSCSSRTRRSPGWCGFSIVFVTRRMSGSLGSSSRAGWARGIPPGSGTRTRLGLPERRVVPRAEGEDRDVLVLREAELVRLRGEERPALRCTVQSPWRGSGRARRPRARGAPISSSRAGGRPERHDDGGDEGDVDARSAPAGRCSGAAAARPLQGRPTRSCP